MNDDVVAVLQRAKELIAAGWCTGNYAKRRDGKGVGILPSPTAELFCVHGAIYQVAGMGSQDGLPIRLRAFELLAVAVGEESGDCLVGWNDAPDRTQAEVLDAFDAAIRLAKESA